MVKKDDNNNNSAESHQIESHRIESNGIVSRSFSSYMFNICMCVVCNVQCGVWSVQCIFFVLSTINDLYVKQPNASIISIELIG